MMRHLVALLWVVTVVAAAAAQYPPPAVVLGAPVPADAPPLPFVGARYSLHATQAPCQSFSFYGPGYVAPRYFNPRYTPPGPYYSLPTYPYSPSYYSYYYTPGFFRY